MNEDIYLLTIGDSIKESGYLDIIKKSYNFALKEYIKKSLPSKKPIIWKEFKIKE